MFESLEKDVESFERDDLDNKKFPEHKDEISALEKVRTALQRTREEDKIFEILLEDISMSLDSVRCHRHNS